MDGQLLHATNGIMQQVRDASAIKGHIETTIVSSCNLQLLAARKGGVVVQEDESIVAVVLL